MQPSPVDEIAPASNDENMADFLLGIVVNEEETLDDAAKHFGSIVVEEKQETGEEKAKKRKKKSKSAPTTDVAEDAAGAFSSISASLDLAKSKEIETDHPKKKAKKSKVHPVKPDEHAEVGSPPNVETTPPKKKAKKHKKEVEPVDSDEGSVVESPAIERKKRKPDSKKELEKVVDTGEDVPEKKKKENRPKESAVDIPMLWEIDEENVTRAAWIAGEIAKYQHHPNEDIRQASRTMLA